MAADNLFSQQNSYKAYTGYLMGLRDPKLMELKRQEESELRAAVARDPKLRGGLRRRPGTSSPRPTRSTPSSTSRTGCWRPAAIRGSDLFRIARDVVRLAEERPKPNDQRLREYRDSALPGVEASLYAAIPIYRFDGDRRDRRLPRVPAGSRWARTIRR